MPTYLPAINTSKEANIEQNTPIIPISDTQTSKEQQLKELGNKLRSGIKGAQYKEVLREYQQLKQQMNE